MPRGDRTESERGEREGQENKGREELFLPTEMHSASAGKTENERSPLINLRECVCWNTLLYGKPPRGVKAKECQVAGQFDVEAALRRHLAR
jgi:hypothetical protein